MKNAVNQIIRANDFGLYHYTWIEKEKSHSYEIDFLVSNGNKIILIEDKSIVEFSKKYS
ncbi:MAG: hypothetical protein PUA56_02535 [Bacillales bacterium]|nr:hypothetical protein [Bacillales bacterium]